MTEGMLTEPAERTSIEHGPKSARWPRAVWGVTLALLISGLLLQTVRAERADPTEIAITLIAVMAYATVGALITSRQPGNRVGLLFSWVGAWAAIGLACASYATLALQRDLPFLSATAWIDRASTAVLFGSLAFLFLIFPTGEPPSRRWRWILRVMLVAYAVNIGSFALTPGPLNGGSGDLNGAVQNPIGLPLSWMGAVEGITEIAGLVVLAGGLLGIVSLTQRFRQASGVERQQIRWLLFLAASLGALLLIVIPLGIFGVIPEDENSFIGNAFFSVFFFGVFFGVPATSAIAILRYRLYDLDVVIKKTVLYATVALLLVTVFLGVAVGVGGVVIEASPAAIGASLAMGLAFWPAVRFARRVADRVVYGRRATPYEVLADFSHRVGGSYAAEDVLSRMAQILATAVGAEKATIWLRVGGELRPAGVAPVGGADPAPVRVISERLPELPSEAAVEVRDRGELLGALAVSMPANDSLDPSRQRLVADLASQAGLVLRNVRLIEELRASRQRLVAAQDEERRKIERNIHDGAQQQLVSLSVKLRLLGQLASRDPVSTAQMADQLQAEATEALEDLRDLARGIYPPLLADKGLGAALDAQARKSAVPLSVETDGVGRYPQDVESALYFCCLEALQNVAKYANATHAEVRLSASGDELAFEVVDDGDGFDPGSTRRGSGLQGMADRVDAIGGTLEVRSQPGRGTTVTGRVLVGASEQA